jgi:DNA-binding response OmpR family regulator
VVAAPVEPEVNPAAPDADVADAATRKTTGERVLVVEDSRTIAAVVKYYLELEGFEVLVATDGLIGLETARRELPHVIVADLNMPGMDGLAMVKELRADARTRDIAIAMLTSEASVESETLAFAGGADDYMLKPVEPRRLAARVKALAARSRMKHLSATA